MAAAPHDTPPRSSGTLRREQSYEEANVWAPRRSPTGRIFVGADGNHPADGTSRISSSTSTSQGAHSESEGSSNDSTPRSRDSQEQEERSFGGFRSGSDGGSRRGERSGRGRSVVGPGIGSVYIAGTTGPGEEGGEVVFALARGVATVVTLSALALVMVLLIIAEAVLMVVAEKIGLAPVVVLVLAIMFVVGRQMGVPFQSLARVLVFLWAF